MEVGTVGQDAQGPREAIGETPVHHQMAFQDSTVTRRESVEPVHPRSALPVSMPRRFDAIISPDVPAKARKVITKANLRRLHPGTPLVEAEPWSPIAVVALVPASSGSIGALLGFLFQAADDNPGDNVLGWTIGVGAIGLAVGTGITGALIRRWWLRQLEHRWSEFVITPERQQAAANAAPKLGARLAWLEYLIRHIRRTRAFREGWLPGITEDALSRLQFALANELLATTDLRAAVAAAGDRPMFAEQVAARREQLAAFDAAFDAQLDHLKSIIATAKAIEQRLDDLTLAERLGSGAPTAWQLRQQFPAAAPADLAAMDAAAHEAARLVEEALDPNRLYPA